MLDLIQHIDEALLKFVHLRLANSFLDLVLPFVRNAFFWSPFYLFLLIWMWSKYRKQGLWWCAYLIVVFALCDFTSASIIKPLVGRLRPCNDVLPFEMRDLVTCGAGYSFPSSHASNHVGLAVYMIFTIGDHHKWVKPFVSFWVVSICFAQLYVGVHYVSDLLGGALLGTIWGYIIAIYLNKRHTLNNA